MSYIDVLISWAVASSEQFPSLRQRVRLPSPGWSSPTLTSVSRVATFSNPDFGDRGPRVVGGVGDGTRGHSRSLASRCGGIYLRSAPMPIYSKRLSERR